MPPPQPPNLTRRRLFVSAGGSLLTSMVSPALAAGVEPTEIDADPPELIGGPWLNSKPMTLEGRRGKVTVVHFWTFG